MEQKMKHLLKRGATPQENTRNLEYAVHYLEDDNSVKEK